MSETKADRKALSAAYDSYNSKADELNEAEFARLPYRALYRLVWKLRRTNIIDCAAAIACVRIAEKGLRDPPRSNVRLTRVGRIDRAEALRGLEPTQGGRGVRRVDEVEERIAVVAAIQSLIPDQLPDALWPGGRRCLAQEVRRKVRAPVRRRLNGVERESGTRLSDQPRH